ncbi:hypothetical protein [Paenibacillus prosopidis]|uniref:Uncharacterized protein n=1 Tax=Paenibacillus prosopidis TaxID=630520 RepID=A0A368VVT7_9BACL|nr:hypothetical protein [Paenibacillus prosopidis]RCW44255.1 hypothetical protein DFP97_112119 [Paenibacillus prosopidis]
MINPRFQPGGDKYESIREDERRAFYDRVEAEKEEIRSAIKTVVSCWTENEIEAGNVPTFEHFIDEYFEWDHQELYPIIIAEMERVEKIIESEKRGRISGVS